ncbi:MAG: metal-dependent phosphohydrolase, partial [Myxococcota bacterium]
MEQQTYTEHTDPALLAVRWAADLPTHPELAKSPPKRPSPKALRAIPVADLRVELDRLLCSKNPDHGLEALHQMGVLDAWLPEVAAMVGFGDGEWRHKDVWKHTKQVVR